MKTKSKLFIAFIFLMSTVMVSAQENSKEKEDFKPTGKVWGYVFGDYYFKVHSDSMNRGSTQYSNISENMNTFEFRRVYLGYDYSISEKFSTELILGYEPGVTLSDGVTRSFMLKSANLRWKNIFKNNDLVIGQSSTPSFSKTSEKVWGYRSVEKTIGDMRKIASSNDVGVALQGKLDDEDHYGYNIMVANGTAVKIPTKMFKRFYGDFYAKFLDKKIILDIYGDYYRSQLSPYHKSLTTGKVFLAYQNDKVTTGIEVFLQQAENNAVYYETDSLQKFATTTSSFGYSVFVKGNIKKDKLNFFARYDSYDPDMNYDNENTYTSGGAPNTETFITAGVDYAPHKNVHIIPNIWYNSYSNRAKNVSGLSKNDYDLSPRVTFYYVFK